MHLHAVPDIIAFLQIMNEKREQPKHSRAVSLNEPFRKRCVDRVNYENQLMMERLKRVTPVINNSAFQVDFKKHLQAESHLRRRQMKPLAVPKDMYRGSRSPLRSPQQSQSLAVGETGMFDSHLYTAQRSGPMMSGSGGLDQLSSLDASPIRSVADFRKQVIVTKKLQHEQAQAVGIADAESPQASIKRPLPRPYEGGDSLFELRHAPS